MVTIATLRAQHPEFDAYGYTDHDIVDWYHAFRTRGGRDDITVADTARELGLDIPDSNFANSWQQAWNDQKANYAAFARIGTEDVSDPTRGPYIPLSEGVNPPSAVPIQTTPPEPGFNQFTRDLKAGLRDTRQLLQEGLDLYRQDLSQQNQSLQRYNTYPQSFEEMQFGDDEKGLTAYMANLAAQSGPETLTIAGGALAGGLPGAYLAGLPTGTGRMAGAQQDRQGYTSGSAFAQGAGYAGLGLLGFEAQAITRAARPGLLANLGSRSRNAAYQGTTGTAAEMVGEVGQTALEASSEGYGPLSAEATGRYGEAAIGAAFLGGPISTATGFTVGPQQQQDLMQSTDFQPPSFPAFSGETTQPVPTGRDFGAEPIVGPPRPARFDPEQIAQAIPVEEITMETVPTEGIDVTEIELPTESIDITPVQDTTTPRLPPRLREVETKPITSSDNTLTVENVGQAMADLVQQVPDTKYTNADLDWANRNLVGKTVEEIAAVDTRSPKRQALLQQISDSAPSQQVVSPDPQVPTTGIEVQEIQSIEAVAPRDPGEKVIEATKKALTERQRQVLDIMMDNPGIAPTEIATKLSELTGTKVARQRVENVQKALRTKLEKAANEFGLNPEQLQEVIAAEGAAQRAAAGAPAQPDQTVAELPPEAIATADQAGDTNQLQSFGEVASPGASQADIAATDEETTIDPVTGKKIATGYAWLRENDPDSPTMSKAAQKLWTAQKKGLEGVPPYRQLGPEHKRMMIDVARRTRDMPKAEQNEIVAEAMNRILGDFQSDTYQQRVRDEQKRKAKEEAKAKPTSTRNVSRETTVARAVWESVTDDVDNNWDTLTERQQEIFQFEVENLANKTGLTEASLNRTVREIVKRVTVDGGAYYEGMYRRTPSKNGSQASQVAGWTRKFREGLGDWVKVNVVQSVAEIPKRVDGKAHPDDIAGTFVDGQVFLVADNIGNKREALETVAHEVVGHLGLETLLGETEFNALVDEIQKLVADHDPAVAAIVAHVRSTYVNSEGHYVMGPVDEAREVLAHLAQRNPRHGLVRKILAKIRMALAKLGLTDMNAALLESLMVEAGSFVRTQFDGTAATSRDPMYIRRSPLEDYHAQFMALGVDQRSKNIAELVKKAKATNERFAGARGSYRTQWETLQKEYRDPDKFRRFVANHTQRVAALNKRLKAADRGMFGFKPYDVQRENAASLYAGNHLMEFVTAKTTQFKMDDVTVLAADMADGQITVMFHLNHKFAGHDGLVGVLVTSELGTDLSFASEKDIGEVQAYTTVPWDLQLTGASAEDMGMRAEQKGVPSGTYELSVKGPTTQNPDFREQWVDKGDASNFELHLYDQYKKDLADKAPLKAGTVAPGDSGRHYVRVAGNNQRLMNDIVGMMSRAQASVFPDKRPPNVYQVRTTGGAQGKEGFYMSNRLEHMYHRRREAAQHRVQSAMAREVKSHWKAFSQRVGPELLNLKGIVDVYGQALPSLRDYYKSVSQMEALQTHLAAEAQAVATKWNTVPDKEKLDALAMDATMDQIHPDVAFTDPKNAHLEKSARTKHARLAARYQALSPEGKEVYQLARDKMRADWDMRGDLYSQVVGMAYADAIQNADTQEAKNDLMKKRDEAIEAHKKKLSEMKGPYFPLMRFGPYIAIWKSPRLKELEAQYEQSEGMVAKALAKEIDEKKKDGAHYIVRSFENQPAMDRFLGEDTHTGWYSQLADPADPKAKDITKLGMDKVKEYLSKNVDSDTRTSIERMLAQLYVGTLPENHALARELRRQGIEGAETDMLRAFATATEKMSFYLSRFKFRDVISERLSDLKAEAASADEGTTDVSNKKVFQHVMKRYKADLDFHETPIQNFIARLSGLHHLASPAYWMVNATQPWLIGAPYAAARLGGMSRVLPEMRKAFGEAYSLIEQTVKKDGTFAPLNVERVANESERQMLRYLIDHGRIDINITAELGALAKSGVTNMDRLSNIMMWPAHQVETSNRLTLALATFRLARRKGMNYKDAVQLVDDTIVNTQVDYSNINAPYYMKTGVTPLGKLVFQFRKYQQAMVQLLALQSRAALKGDKQARATLAYLVGTQLAMGGVASTPGIGVIYLVANMFIDDDDEDGDAETQMRNAMADWIGPDAARIAWKGLPAGVGMDLSKRTGMGDIFAPLPFIRTDGRTGEEALGNIALNAAGAWTSIGKGVWDSALFFEDGNIWRGLESAVPLKGIRDLSKAIRYEVDGLTTRSQNVGVSPDGFSPWDTLQRGLGLSSLKETEYYEVRSAKARTERAINDLRNDLLRDYSFARMAGDSTAQSELMAAIAAFNQEHPEFRIDGSTRRSAYRNRRRYNRVNDQGVAEQPGRQRLESLTRFAN